MSSIESTSASTAEISAAAGVGSCRGHAAAGGVATWRDDLLGCDRRLDHTARTSRLVLTRWGPALTSWSTSPLLRHECELWRLSSVRSMFGGTIEIMKEIIGRGHPRPPAALRLRPGGSHDCSAITGERCNARSNRRTSPRCSTQTTSRSRARNSGWRSNIFSCPVRCRTCCASCGCRKSR